MQHREQPCFCDITTEDWVKWCIWIPDSKRALKNCLLIFIRFRSLSESSTYILLVCSHIYITCYILVHIIIMHLLFCMQRLYVHLSLVSSERWSFQLEGQSSKVMGIDWHRQVKAGRQAKQTMKWQVHVSNSEKNNFNPCHACWVGKNKTTLLWILWHAWFQT